MKITLLTYNIFCRPFPVFNVCNICRGGDVKTPRLKKFIEIINKEDYDIICLQEIFAKCDCGRIDLIETDTHKNLKYHRPKQTLGCLEFDSGLAILSKLCISVSKFEKFTDAKCADAFAQKVH